MKTALQLFTAFLGTLVGLTTGGGAAFYLTVAVGYACYGDNFGQIGWLYVLFTVPIGAIFGGFLGTGVILLRPRLFAGVFLPPFLALITWQVVYHHLRHKVDTPRDFVVKVTGKPGEGFLGAIQVDDDKKHFVHGELPAEFAKKGLKLQLAFALAQQNKDSEIEVEVFVEGKSKIQFSGEFGVKMELDSFGYNEWFGGTSYRASILDQQEVDRLRR